MAACTRRQTRRCALWIICARNLALPPQTCIHHPISDVYPPTHLTPAPTPAPPPQTGQVVAIKKINVGGSNQGIDMTSLREIKLLKELRSPYIVRLLDVFPHKRKLTMVGGVGGVCVCKGRREWMCVRGLGGGYRGTVGPTRDWHPACVFTGV